MICGARRCELGKRMELCRILVFVELLFFVLLLSFEHSNVPFCLGLNSEGLALLRFRERVVRDPFNALSSWKVSGENGDPCSWFGVECADGNVVALKLKDLCLRGTLTPELGKLTRIRSINLQNNSFHGIVPREIAALKELEVLDFGYNNFTEPVLFKLLNNPSPVIFSLNNNGVLDGACPKYKFALSDDQIDENQLNSVTTRAPCHGQFVSGKTGQHVVFIQRSRRLLQSSALSPVSSPAPSRSHSPLGSPQGPSTQSTILPPSLSPSPSPSPSPISSPVPAPSPAHKLHSPAPAPSTKTGTTSSEKTPAVEPSSRSSKLSLKVLWISIAGGSIAVTVSVVAFMICRSSKVVTVKPWATGLSGQLQKAFVSGVPKLKRAELETACEDFSNIIGTLADSTVYKGTLSSGVEIAVVSSSVTSRQQWSKNLEAQFRKKVETLSKVNHKNFVNLIGFCEEENPFTRMMVFEYAPNGTLFEHLHIKEAERLDWKMRMRIVMGMAYCLEHMHKLNPPIPHRDLHSSSVYLSQDYAAKLSDFSFWTDVTPEKMRSPSMQLLEASMADKESNVHSFGILLFEIVTGKIPYSHHNGAVEDWVWEYLRGNHLPTETIDPTLTTFHDEQIQQLFEIMKDCVHPDPMQRPAMRAVALRLMEITGVEPDGATPKISPLWWAELEVLASEAA